MILDFNIRKVSFYVFGLTVFPVLQSLFEGISQLFLIRIPCESSSRVLNDH